MIANEGAGALLTGAGATFSGYFVQGAFKFGGYEFFKKQSIDYLGLEKARANRGLVYAFSAASAEFFASVALCPLEATRIRLVSTPGFANGLIGGWFLLRLRSHPLQAVSPRNKTNVYTRVWKLHQNRALSLARRLTCQRSRGTMF